MIKAVSKNDIPSIKKQGRSKSDWRLKAEKDIQYFLDSDDEAIEFLDIFSDYEMKRRRSVLRDAIKDLGIENVKVVQRGNRLFVVKDDDYE